MLAIKLQRRGKKHQPSYRVVVQEKRSKLNGEAIDDLGWFDPKSHNAEINKERVAHWVGVGAQPTPTVHNLLITKGIIHGKKIPVHKHVVKEKVEVPIAPTAETAQKAEAAPVEVAEAPEEAPAEKPEEPKAEEAPAAPQETAADEPKKEE